jgi:hypothetical protein
LAIVTELSESSIGELGRLALGGMADVTQRLLIFPRFGPSSGSFLC